VHDDSNKFQNHAMVVHLFQKIVENHNETIN